MDAPFPFGLPGATALYLTLYVVTLTAHAVLVSYVLAGTGYVAAVRGMAALRGGDPDDPLAPRIADWLPFGLGAAITAGVAPLLFLQILYKESFYTANLLLFHRWMAVVPVLIAGFYLLYLGKSKLAASWRPSARTAVAAAAFLCFAFVGYSWTENHLLALDRDGWVEQYASGASFYPAGRVIVRFLFWLAMSAPLMAAIAGWQLRAARADTDVMRRASRRLAGLALAGLTMAALLAWLLQRALPAGSADLLWSGALIPYISLAMVGGLAQLLAWGAQLRAGALTAKWMAAASAGVLLTVVGGAVLREGFRLHQLGSDGLFALHERASGAGGMPAFIFFLLFNAAVIIWCFRITMRGLRDRA